MAGSLRPQPGCDLPPRAPGVLAFDRRIAPVFDRRVNLLVQVRYGRGRYPRAPQGLRDVLDPAYRHANTSRSEPPPGVLETDGRHLHLAQLWHDFLVDDAAVIAPRAFKRMDKVTAEKGYAGPVVVLCRWPGGDRNVKPAPSPSSQGGGAEALQCKICSRDHGDA
jgi:hypothetical protein